MFQPQDWQNFLLLAKAPGVGIKRLKKIFAYCKSLDSYILNDLASFGVPQSEALAQYLKNPPFKEIEQDLKWAENQGCRIVHFMDNLYPKRLAEINSAPTHLYVQGNIEVLNLPQIAVVGSRNPSQQGLINATQFAKALSQNGFVITSGLALGIDEASHFGALEDKGTCIAVLGSGHCRLYPRKNIGLAQRIIDQQGIVLSEYAPYTEPMASNFPLRNRIISGLSLGVLVIEAALKSGSLITARYAAEQGREVFALPGSIHHSLNKGCHDLIKNGAKLVESIQDILDEFSIRTLNTDLFQNKTSQNTESQKVYHTDTELLSDDQNLILNYIDFNATSVDKLIEYSGFTAPTIISIITELILLGIVTEDIGGYSRIRF